jgi:hypothetical protein
VEPNLKKQNKTRISWAQWCKPITSTNQEAETRGSQIEGQLGPLGKTLCQNIVSMDLGSFFSTTNVTKQNEMTKKRVMNYS